ncbi:MAG TPA: hypothetical protein DCS93_40945 [Microscillaceae bacterium]|nr:hypothetical protein [Microscillaceae bacterium]
MKKFIYTTLMLCLIIFNALAQTREEIQAAKQAALLRVIGYVAIGVVVAVLAIVAIWLLVVKKEKDRKIKVKTYSPKDTYYNNEGGGDGFQGGF